MRLTGMVVVVSFFLISELSPHHEGGEGLSQLPDSASGHLSFATIDIDPLTQRITNRGSLEILCRLPDSTLVYISHACEPEIQIQIWL